MQNKFSIRNLNGIMVTNMQVNFKTKTLTRERKPITRHYVYDIMKKYYAGVPIEYIALQYQITLEEIKRIVKEGVKIRRTFPKKKHDAYNIYAESFQFFMNLGTPIHVMARLYKTDVDSIIEYTNKSIISLRYWMSRAKMLYKRNMTYHYFETPEGAATIEHVKKMIKWKQR